MRSPPSQRRALRHEAARRGSRRARRPRREAPTSAPSSSRRKAWQASVRPAVSSTVTVAPIEFARPRTTSPRLRWSSTRRSIRRWIDDGALEHVELFVDQAGEGPLGDRDERHLVGHAEKREVELARLVDAAPPAASRVRSRGRSRAREVVLDESADVGALGVLVVQLHAGVSSSSPPDSHGAGSSSSETWTQRIGAPAARSPATSSSSSVPTRSLTLSSRRSGRTHRLALAGLSARAERSRSISSNCSLSAISGGASWITGSPRSSARQISPRANSAPERNLEQLLGLLVGRRSPWSRGP